MVQLFTQLLSKLNIQTLVLFVKIKSPTEYSRCLCVYWPEDWLIADSNLLYSSSYHYDLALPYSTTWHPVSPDINNRNSLQEIQCQDNHGGCLAMMEPGQYWTVNGDGKD